MSFESFQLSRVDVGEATLRVRHGGAGPPLLLLHGYPETRGARAPTIRDQEFYSRRVALEDSLLSVRKCVQ